MLLSVSVFTNYLINLLITTISDAIVLLCCCFFFVFRCKSLFHRGITPHQLLYYFRICCENLPREFAAAICYRNLPLDFGTRIFFNYLLQEFAAGICHGNLPQEFVVAICRRCFVNLTNPISC